MLPSKNRPTANTRDCFSQLVGHKVIGVLFDALPISRRDIAAGTKTLVLDDGNAITIASSGSYWWEDPDDVARAIKLKRAELDATRQEIASVLALAGDAT